MENLSDGSVDAFEHSMRHWLDGLRDPSKRDLHPAYASVARKVLEHHSDHPQGHYFRNELERLGYGIS